MTTNCIGLQTSTNWKGTNTKDKWTDRSSERYKIDWEKEEMTN